jgi:hypothetical protein
MKFLIQWSQSQATYRPAVEHFLKTGANPPAGVTLVGRWVGMNGKGCMVVESDDAKALFEFFAEWSEFFPIETTPLVEDAELGEVLSKLYG